MGIASSFGDRNLLRLERYDHRVFSSLRVPTSDRYATLRRHLIVFLLGIIVVTVQGCGGGTNMVSPVSPTINPLGTALSMKEIFTGDTINIPFGNKSDEFVAGVLYGGSLIQSQANLDLFWTHPVFSKSARPVVDFTNQTLVVYTVATGPSSKVSISRISNSQVIVTQCHPTGLFPGVLDYFVSMKLIDVVLVGTPKFEVQNEQAALC
jgi:hypothetical protein